MNAEQKRLVQTETLIATCLCSVLPSLAIFFLYEPFPVLIWGVDGLVGFAAKSTTVAVVLMASLMTLGTRSKVSKGLVAPLDRNRFGWLHWVPRMLVLRVPLFAVVAALGISVLTAVFVLLTDLEPLQRPSFVMYNLVLGALIGFLMTPLIQCSALADIPAASSMEKTEEV